MLDPTSLLRMLAESGGSDLHLIVGQPPVIRVDGQLRRLEGKPLAPDDTALIAQAIIPADRRDLLMQQKEVDFAHTLAGVGRFRVNVFRQRGSISIVLRRVRIGSASFDDLGIPPVVRELASAPRGLVLVTGPTGSGKTTTLAAMIDHINSTKAVHVLTIEDPIEVLHPHRKASINQREIGVDTDSYVAAMRAAMRQDPDVILIGEMRDTETVFAALAAAETGEAWDHRFAHRFLKEFLARRTAAGAKPTFAAHLQGLSRRALGSVEKILKSLDAASAGTAAGGSP